MTDIPYIIVLLFHNDTMGIVTITVVPDGTAWFSVRHLGRGPEYI